MWYLATGCATGVLPDDRVCYRRVAELPGVLPDEQAFYWSEICQLDLEIEPGNSGTRTRTSTRTLTRQLELEVELLPARYRTTGCVANDRTTGFVTGALPNVGRVHERPGVLPVRYRTTGCMIRPG